MRKYVPFLLVLLSSCVSYERCKQKFGAVQTDTLTVTDTIPFFVPGDTIRAAFRDTTHFIYRETKRTKLILNKDTIVCLSKAVTDTVYKERRAVLARHHWAKKEVYPWWVWTALGVAGLAFALVGLFVFMGLKNRI